MAPVRLVTKRQMEILVEFAEQNQDIAVNRRGSLLFNYRHATAAWARLTKELNSVNGGILKTPDKWKRYWHLLKCRTKTKASDVRRCSDNGDPGTKMMPLTDHEERIVRVLAGLVPEKAQTPAKEEVPILAEPESNRLSPESSRSSPEPDPVKSVDEREMERPRKCRSNGDDTVPKWVCDLEERRIEAEERIADAVVTLSHTNESMLQCLQQMAATQAQLVGILEQYLHPPH